MFYSYLLSAAALAAMGLGALLYTAAGQGERKVEGAQPRNKRRSAARASLCAIPGADEAHAGGAERLRPYAQVQATE